MKHTPGPWIVSHMIGCRHVDLEKKFDAFHIMTANGDRSANRDEGEANTRLIAAAPEMLEAMTIALKSIASGAPWNAGQLLLKTIAKAKGEK